MGEHAESPVQTAKRELRDRVRAALRAAGDQERAAWSGTICRRLEELDPIRAARVVLEFLPLPTEPNIEPLVRGMLGRGVRVALPRVDWASGRMEAVEIGDLDRELVSGRHGLREPRPGLAVLDFGVLDVVLVPGVAFDAGGGRLGRGGGFYDRFLSSHGLRAARIGVAFENQVVERVPSEAHDARVEAIVTERRVLLRPPGSGCKATWDRG